ncbi:MAG: HAD-IIIA family hydrolase, partial [Akkermansiaceae bacterium]|nr:HAD-IIIA family hydrolase [Akkermansiaceae bacterium]
MIVQGGDHMIQQIEEHGGKINKVYACSSLNDDDPNRKPNIGMAMQAKEDVTSIDFKKSVMVGNNMSDMLFGKRVGMRTIFLCTTNSPVTLPHDTIDEQYHSLKDWADSLQAK